MTKLLLFRARHPGLFAALRRLVCVGCLGVALTLADVYGDCIAAAYYWEWDSSECESCMNAAYNTAVANNLADYNMNCANDLAADNACIASWSVPSGTNFISQYNYLYTLANCGSLSGSAYTDCTASVYASAAATAAGASGDPNGLCNSAYVSSLANDLATWTTWNEINYNSYISTIGNWVRQKNSWVDSGSGSFPSE